MFICNVLESSSLKYPYIQLILMISTFLILLGRGLQLLIWDAPFRAVLWDEDLMKPLVEGVFNTSWQSYATDLSIDKKIDNSVKISGVILLFGAILTPIRYFKRQKWMDWVIFLCFILMLFIVSLEFKDIGYRTPQFLEGSIQVFTPLLFIAQQRNRLNKGLLINAIKLIISLTFVGHGLYAMNIYPTPGHFVDMVIVLLGIDETSARIFLQIIGWCDIILALGIWFKATEKPTLWYAFIWGILTAFARYISVLKLTHFDSNSFEILHKTIYRIPHGLLALSLIIQNKKSS